MSLGDDVDRERFVERLARLVGPVDVCCFPGIVTASVAAQLRAIDAETIEQSRNGPKTRSTGRSARAKEQQVVRLHVTMSYPYDSPD
jgi:hypothetical protein